MSRTEEPGRDPDSETSKGSHEAELSSEFVTPPADRQASEADSLGAVSILERLLDLAHDASTYLRQSARPAVRISAALLLAASLAACSGTTSGPSLTSPSANVSALSREVRSGLPTQPGRYPLVAGSLNRDAQGVYHFGWMAPGGRSTQASISSVRLAQGAQDEIDVPPQGDPTLYLDPNTAIPLGATTGSQAGQSYGNYALWHPFYGGYYGAGYYDPPLRTVQTGGQVNGAHVSTAPAPPSARTVDVAHTVSGRAGGTGSGSAASQKAGVSTSSGKAGFGSGSAASAKSGGFSSGRGGGTGSSGS